MENHDTVLVSAPNRAGEGFIRQLKARQIPVAVIVNNKAEYQRMTQIGVTKIVKVDTAAEETWILPEVPVGQVYLFERSLNLVCRYLQICRSWTSKRIYVITGSQNPRLVYKGLGADYIIYSSRSDNDCSFLITDDLMVK